MDEYQKEKNKVLKKAGDHMYYVAPKSIIIKVYGLTKSGAIIRLRPTSFDSIVKKATKLTKEMLRKDFPRVVAGNKK